MGFGDALICYVANMYSGELYAFVSWNTAHFRTKLDMDVLTPSEALEALSTPDYEEKLWDIRLFYPNLHGFQ